MILRKPYAFLIKNFKKIHLLLFVALVAVYFYTSKVFGFFNEYQKSRQIFFENSLVEQYISVFMFVIPIIIIAISIVIFILMRQKDKPLKLYVFIIIFYIFLMVLFFVDWNYLNEIYIKGLDPRTVRVIRDANFIFLILQFVFMALILIRAIGFDIKKFDFGEDIVKLNIDITDDEEFELTSGINIDKISRKYRREIRELEYFLKENKQIIFLILISIVLSISSYIYVDTQVINKIYKEEQTININDLNITVENSYTTKKDYNATNVSDKGYTYFIVKLSLNNKDDESKKLSLENLNLVINGNIYNAINTKYAHFIDLGNGYYDQAIASNTEKKYIYVFKVKDDDIGNKTILRYTDKVVYKNDKLKSKYSRVLLNPISLDNITDFKVANLNEKIYYGLSLLKETTLKINSIDFNNTFEYTNNGVKNNITELLSTNTILKLSYEFDLDKDISYINNFGSMLDKFGKISYIMDGKTYTVNYKNITPKGYKGNEIYLSVDNKIINTNRMKLTFIIRNMRYTYQLID